MEKSIPRLCAASGIFANVAKENNRPKGEKSPNLGTLPSYHPKRTLHMFASFNT
jgi:hypothetical protein